MKTFPSRIAPVLLLCFSAALATRAADNAPTVDSILDKFVEASGGKAALEKVTSRTIKGELDAFGSNSEWVMLAKVPNKQLTEFTSPTFGYVGDGFDGTVAWSKNQAGVRVKEGEELAKTKRDADFRRDLNFKKVYPGLAYKGTEKFDTEEAHVLEAKPSTSSKERFLFSAKSGLLIGQESEFENADGKLSVSARMSDFRAVDGVKYAHSMKFKIAVGGQEFEFSIKLKEVKHNATIEDSKFAKPAE